MRLYFVDENNKINYTLPMMLSPDYSSQRDRNLALFVRHLRELAPLSRAQMAELMNVNRSTVSNLADELIGRGLVHEVGLENPSSGRPGRLLEINPAAGFVVGCELGLTYIRVALTDFGGQVQWQTETPLKLADGQEAVVQTAVTLIQQAAGHCSGRMLGVGVTVPGWIDQQQE
ncbi:MAG: ROK family transcriptional regulator, partial [Anaerolineales bacterium]|nr:ROK family transcriptional regulator [Anaerolineales bacterium]